MEELASSISDFIGSSWKGLALMDRVRDRIGDCLHFKATNRAIASDAAGILAAIERIVRRSQRLVSPARCSSPGTLDLASPRDGKAPRMRRRSMLLVAASAENTTSSRVVTSWILGVSTRSAVTVAPWLLIALAKPRASAYDPRTDHVKRCARPVVAGRRLAARVFRTGGLQLGPVMPGARRAVGHFRLGLALPGSSGQFSTRYGITRTWVRGSVQIAH